MTIYFIPCSTLREILTVLGFVFFLGHALKTKLFVLFYILLYFNLMICLPISHVLLCVYIIFTELKNDKKQRRVDEDHRAEKYIYNLTVILFNLFNC